MRKDVCDLITAGVRQLNSQVAHIKAWQGSLKESGHDIAEFH